LPLALANGLRNEMIQTFYKAFALFNAERECIFIAVGFSQRTEEGFLLFQYLAMQGTGAKAPQKIIFASWIRWLKPTAMHNAPDNLFF